MHLVDFQYIHGGVRKLAAVKETLERMQEAYKEAVAFLTDGIIAQGAGVTVLYGCVNSGTLPDYDISAGAVYYNGEIYEVPAFAGTATGADVPCLSLNTSYRAGDPALYKKADGTSESINTHSIRKLLWSFAPSGSGIADFSAVVTIKSRIAGLFTGEFAPLNNPAFTGAPTAPTASTSTDTTQIAATAFVHAVVAALVDSLQQMICNIVACGPSGQYWNGKGFSIGVNDCKKWGYEVDILVVMDSFQKFPERKKIVEDSRPREYLLGRDFWRTHPSYKPIPLVPPYMNAWKGRLEKGKFYGSKSSPFIAVPLAYSMGFDKIVLWGVDFENHPIIRGHRLKEEVERYVSLQNELLKNGCSMYLGQVAGFENHGSLAGLIPNFLSQ